MAVRFVFFAFYHSLGDDRIAGRSARGPAAPTSKPKILVGHKQDGRREVVAADRYCSDHREGGHIFFENESILMRIVYYYEDTKK